MTDSHGALVALAGARRSDPILVSLLAAGAARIKAQAQVEAEALRQEAKRLRHDALVELRSAKSEFEAAQQRLTAIRGLEITSELKAVALRAASLELARTRGALRAAAESVEATVSAARELNARAETVLRHAAARPEVAAWVGITSATRRAA